jgi:hypothetical protein
MSKLLQQKKTWLWSSEAPGTFKNFVWRVAHDLLPTREVLSRRHVTANPFYSICSREQESIFHILWQCSCWKKINWDAALELSNKRIGMGLVVRDGAGVVEAVSTVCIPFVTDPMLAEALGACHALLFCRQQRYTHVVFEGDSQVVVNALKKDGPCWTSFGQIIEDT